MRLRDIVGSADLEEEGTSDEVADAAPLDLERQQPQPEGTNNSSGRYLLWCCLAGWWVTRCPVKPFRGHQ